jgi:ribosome-associated translation inhibitor RaiA
MKVKTTELTKLEPELSEKIKELDHKLRDLGHGRVLAVIYIDSNDMLASLTPPRLFEQKEVEQMLAAIEPVIDAIEERLQRRKVH